MGADEFSDAPYIYVTPRQLSFYAVEGGVDPESQVLSVSNLGTGTLRWEATYDCSWLTVEPTAGESTGDTNLATLSVDIAGLAMGTYNCDLTISDPCASNNPETVTVTVTVELPEIELSNGEFNFGALGGGANPDDQILAVRNSGVGTLNWAAIHSCSWLTVDPMAGQSHGDADEVTLSVDITGLTADIYNCDLTISDPCASNNPQTVQVSLTVYDVDGILYVPAEYPTIQYAIDVATDGDVVLVASGTYNEDINFNGKNITVSSTDPNEAGVVAGTIIEGYGSGPVVTFAGTETSLCVLAGFTITGGNNTGNGGGIVGAGTGATITHCVITGNVAGYRGGGLYDCDGTISQCEISDNSAGTWGGGLRNCDGLISQCIISGNTAPVRGGGLVNCQGEIVSCVITDNVAGYGGGLNHCDNVIANCTIVNNTAGSGAALWRCGGKVTNCIFRGNNGIEFVESSVPTYSCYVGSSGSSNIDVDPCFVDAAGGDYHLRLDSPCIDAGDPCGWAGSVDIDGYARVANGDGYGSAMVDMGADEVGVISSWHSATQCYGDGDGDGDVDTEDWPAFRDSFGWAYPDARYDVRADLDRDGDVDTVDWPAFRDHFGYAVAADCGYDGVWPPGG